MNIKRLLLIALLITVPLFSVAMLRYILNQKFAIEHEFWIRCNVMPADDTEFTAWLANQPGVTKGSSYRKGNELRITFVMIQNITRSDPPTPDLIGCLERSGYYGKVRITYTNSDFYVHE